jgi:hypothetical protein
MYGMGDLRRPMSERVSIARDVKDKPSCCIPFGAARTINEAEELTVEVLVSVVYVRIWYFLAWQYRMSLSMIKKLHARNRRNADPNMSWANFSAQFVNQEVVHLRDNRLAPMADLKRTRLHSLPQQSPLMDAPPSLTLLEQERERIKSMIEGTMQKRSATQLHWAHWLQTQQRFGHKCYPASSATHAEVA